MNHIKLFIFVFIITILSGQESILPNNDYKNILDRIKSKQLKFQNAYLNSESEENKNSLIDTASNFIFETLTKKIFPAWYGTKWDFNGITRIPKKDAIACGSFVVFTLQDVGFIIPSEMYQQPSENIIKNLTDKSNIKIFSNYVPMQKIISWIKSKGHGLFIVGLDIHVGFIIYSNEAMTFCHSNYYDPPLKVVNQDVLSPSPLTDSKYRILGKILSTEMIKKWLLKKEFKLKYNYFKHN